MRAHVCAGQEEEGGTQHDQSKKSRNPCSQCKRGQRSAEWLKHSLKTASRNEQEKPGVNNAQNLDSLETLHKAAKVL